MHTETAKMIYQNQDIAGQIATAMTKSQSEQFTVIKVTTGFQVCKVNKMPSAMPPWPPLPFKKVQPIGTSETLKDAWAKKDGTAGPVISKPKANNIVHVKMAFKVESPKYVDAYDAEGKPMAFGKSTLLGWDIVEEDGTKFLIMKMDMKVAKKRGITDYIVEM